MATYFHGNSDGGDGLQTLILMNPAYVGYSENQQQPQQQQAAPNGNFLFHHAPPPQTQHFVGVPLQNAAAASSAGEQDASVLHGFLPRVPYNLYNLPMEMASARDATRGLSLSLSSQQGGYGSFRQEREVPAQPMVAAASPRGDDVRVSAGSPSPASGVSNGVNGVLLSSKYLKAAQELLDEVVNVGKGIKTAPESSKKTADSPSAAAADGQSEVSGKRAADLTTAERQEIQMKKAKLVNMLDEVEQRYRQYHHQMQIVISWFEQAAGLGSAKTYTALALQTISKQFRCLKDAIMGQIRAASKSLGEDDGMEVKIEGSSRLKYVDNQIRQQRALQQLGMIQHNAWRPQRGLPERSVSVLRAWLFEHFLHPYPKDSDKIMLAKQTGLTRSQVSNWFINARVRLWKPMVEEMYTEEMKEHEKNGSADKTSKSEQQNEDSTSKSDKTPNSIPKLDNDNNNNNNLINHNMISMSSSSTSPVGPTAIRNISGFDLVGSSEIENLTQTSPKKLRMADMLHSPTSMQSMNVDSKSTDHDSDSMSMKFGGERQGRDGFTLMGAPTNFIGGFGSYPIAELGRFGSDQFQAPYSGNGVSLTLGLPHCENLGPHQTFMPNQGMQLGAPFEPTSGAPGNGHPTNIYESINIQNRKRFAAQLLPDFVA